MIQVNLLPPRIIQERKQRLIKMSSIATGVFLLMGLGLYVFTLFQTINGLEIEIAATKTLAEPFKDKIAEIKRLKSFKGKLEERRKVVGDLVRAQPFYPRLMETIARAMVENSALSQLIAKDQEALGRSIQLTLRGSAVTQTDVYALQKALEVKKEFENVVVRVMKQVTTVKGSTYSGWNFEIQAKYVPLSWEKEV